MEVCHNIVSAGQWNDHSFHPWWGGSTIDEEFVTEAPVESGRSGDTTLSVRPNHSGWVSAPSRGWGPIEVSAAILVRHLGDKANIDMASTQRSNLISVLVLDGRAAKGICQKHFSAWPVHYDQVILLQMEEHSLESCRGPLWRFFRLIISRGLVVCLHDECPSVQVCMEFFHNHIWWPKSSLLMLA